MFAAVVTKHTLCVYVCVCVCEKLLFLHFLLFLLFYLFILFMFFYILYTKLFLLAKKIKEKELYPKCYTASPHVAKLMLYSFNSSCTLKNIKKGFFLFHKSPLLAHFGWLNTLLLCSHYWAITVVEQQQHQLPVTTTSTAMEHHLNFMNL